MRSRSFVMVGLCCLALAGFIALLPTGDRASAPVAPHDAAAGSEVDFSGVLADATALRSAPGPAWPMLASHLDNATYLLTGGDAGVTVLVTLPVPASGEVVVHGRVVLRLADDGTGQPLVLVRGHT